ncbi:MAG: ice-binding family protein [Candidatus Doudnabacteria bacterium]
MVKLNSKISRHGAGFTLIEIVVAIAIFGVLLVGVIGLFNVMSKSVKAGREQTTLSGLAANYLEIIRNLPYSQVGTINGNPNGTLADSISPITSVIEGVSYQIYYEVTYIDDPADGTVLAGTDAAPDDYKQIKMNIKNLTTGKVSSFSTNVTPKGLEGTANAGALFVKVFNAVGQPVVNASVHIQNIAGTIILDRTTDALGNWIEVGLPPGVNIYHVVVTKTGYSTDQTYPITVANPNPTKPDPTIVNGVVTQVSFSIDLLSNLIIRTLNQFCAPLSGVGVNVAGAKLIGTSPNVYKFNSNLTSAIGQILMNNIEWDTYTPTLLTGQNLMVLGTSPIQEISVLPGSSGVATGGGPATAGYQALGSASGFGALAGAAVVGGTGVGSSVAGDVGSVAGTTNFPPSTLTGTVHTNDSVVTSGLADLLTAITAYQAMGPGTVLTGDMTLHGPFAPGVYSYPSSGGITGNIVLDGGGDPNAKFIFLFGSTLTTAAGSTVTLQNGALSDNVSWVIGSSATIGATNTFAGNILAVTSITFGAGSSFVGRALAQGGSVTLAVGGVINSGASVGASSTQTFTMILGTQTTNSLRVIVKDQAMGTALEGAAVHLRKGDSTPQDYYGTTAGSVWVQSDWTGGSGQTDFVNKTRYFSDDGNIDINSNPTGVRLRKVTGQHLPSGQLVSSTFDTGAASNFTNITWQPTSQNPATTLRFQIATNNDNLTWNYKGPDGTAATYYTVSGTNIAAIHDNDRYVRYKVFEDTSDDKYTPVLTSLAVNYVSGCFTPGQVSFGSLTAGNNYDLDITLAGYQTAIVNNLDIFGNQTITVLMNP